MIDETYHVASSCCPEYALEVSGKQSPSSLLHSIGHYTIMSYSKRLLPVHCSGSSQVHFMNVIDDALFWRDSGMFVWNKMAVTQSCSFDNAVREPLRLFPNVPKIKEKQRNV